MSSADAELRSSSRAGKRQKTTHDAPPAAAPTAPGTSDDASTENRHCQSSSAVPSSPQLLDIPRPVLEHIFTFAARVSSFTFAPLGPQRLYEEIPSLALTCSVWNEIASEFRSEFRAVSTVVKFKSGEKSELESIYEDLEARGAKILELELHMGTPQSRGLFKLKKQLRPLSKLDELSIDWDRVFKACPSLLRLSLTHSPLDTIHIGGVLRAASSHCRDLEALILPVAEVKPDDQPGIILRTTSTLYSALEIWWCTHGSKRGLVQLAVAKHHNVEEEDLLARSNEFISAVARFCPNIQYLDGWKATYSDSNGLSCDEMWFCSLDVWKLFCRNCVHIREFNWFTAPFDDDFLKEFALYPKRNLTKMTIAAGGDGVYHPAFSDGSYHRNGGFRFTIEAVIGMLAACPALEELHVLLEGFRSQSKLFKKRLNDDFLAAVGLQCPKLRKLIVNEVIGTHFEKPLPQVTDAGLLSISRLPQLEHVAFMQTLTSPEGILSLIDNARCPRRIVLKVGSASAEPHMQYFSVLCELMRVLASRPPDCFSGRYFELELVIHEERKKISKQDALKAKLADLLEQVRKQHPEVAVCFCEWREKLDRVCDDLNKLESVVFVSPVHIRKREQAAGCSATTLQRKRAREQGQQQERATGAFSAQQTPHSSDALQSRGVDSAQKRAEHALQPAAAGRRRVLPRCTCLHATPRCCYSCGGFHSAFIACVGLRRLPVLGANAQHPQVRHRTYDIALVTYRLLLLRVYAFVNRMRRKVQGRLKVCTRGFFFVPQDIQLPILRFPFRAMAMEPCAECFVEYSEQLPIASSFVSASAENMYLTFQTKVVVEMKERGIDHPYVYKDTSGSNDPVNSSNSNSNSGTPSKYIFTLLYSRLDAFLASIHIIYEVAKLPRRSMNKVDEENLLATVLVPRMTHEFDTSLLVDFREKLLLPAPELVDRVEPLLKYPGCLMLTNLRLYFQPAQLNNVLDPVLNWEYSDIEHTYKRRYLLRQTGLEIYLRTGESFFFSFKSPQIRDDTYAMMVDQPDLQHCRREDLELMMHKWQQREISNFEYLQFLNNAAGRTRNDLTQYPVFPWTLSDYTSSSLDLSDPSVYRDLSKPIGALNEERLEYFKMRYEIMPRGEEAEGMPPPFLFGTHYSTPGYVLYFLVRMAPQLMLCLQNGKFDAPDRLFRSIEVTWQGCVTNHTDLKELIPEFFDTSVPPDEWLCNSQHLDLGTTQNLNRVDDVKLPPWAHRNPREFVRKNREALESDYVSEHLHEWIDLIFGYKQQGDEAVKANNLFYYLSYEGSIDLESVTDPMERCSLESQIQEFGQTPKLLFSTPHPSRNENESKIEVATPDLLPSPRIRRQRVRRLTYPPPDDIRTRYRGRRTVEMTSLAFFNEEDSDDEQLVPLKPRRSFQPGLSLMCFQAPWEGVPKAIEYSSHLWAGMGSAGKPAKKWNWKHKMKTEAGVPHSWSWTESLSYMLHSGEITSAVLSRDDSTLFTTCKDSSLKVSKIADGSVRQTLSCQFALSCCDVSPDERTILIGCWDNCVYMYSARTGHEMDKVLAHSDGISAICIVGNRFLTSSWDSTVKLWRYTPTFIMASPVCTFTECEESVLCLDTSPSGAFGAAGTRNGHVYVFDLNAPALRSDVFVSPHRRGDVSSISFASDSNSYVCITMENELMQLNLQGEQLFSMDVRAPGQVRCFESDGEYAVGGTTNGRIFFWKLHQESGSELICEIPNAHNTIISSLVVSGNGSTLVSGAIDGSVHVWRLAPKSRADFNSKSEASSLRKTSIASITVASKTESSVSATSAEKKKKKRNSASAGGSLLSAVAGSGYRDAAAHYRPLYHLYRPDSANAMEESHYFLEG